MDEYDRVKGWRNAQPVGAVRDTWPPRFIVVAVSGHKMPDWFAHLRRRPLNARTAPGVGPGRRVYAIGDVHGCLAQLQALHAMIVADNARRSAANVTVVYVGDYIDRGPDSRQVLDLVRRPLAGVTTTVHLKGNHEDMLQQFLRDAARGADWLDNGGLQTLTSFKVEAHGRNRGLEMTRAALAVTREALLVALGPELQDWLERLPLSHQIGEYFFCHAGIRPGVALADQNPVDLLWIREPFLQSRRDHGAVIVHGHTPGSAAEVRRNRINIDTGCFASGELTAAVFDGDAAVTLLATTGTVTA